MLKQLVVQIGRQPLLGDFDPLVLAQGVVFDLVFGDFAHREVF